MSLVDLFQQLGVHSQKDDHQKVLEYANRILKSQPDDERAGRAKLVALVNLDKYNAALDLVNKNTALKQSCPIEYAYCLYKTEKLQELEQLESHERGIRMALVQAYYRSEQHSKAYELYKELANEMSAADNSEEYDIAVNQTAVDAAVGKEIHADSKAYDQLFNAACGCIQRRQWEQALELLKQSKAAAEQTLSAADADEESVPILVQAAYVNQELGRLDEAQSILDNIGIDRISDLAVRHIAVNNQIAMRPDANPQADVKRLDSVAPAEHLDARETRRQQQALKGNRLLLQHRAGRALARIADSYIRRYEGAANYGILGALDGGSPDDTPDAKAALILDQYRKHEGNPAYALAAAQLWLDSGKRGAAKQALSLVHNAGHYSAPGFVGAFVAVLRTGSARSAGGDREPYVDILSNAFAKWDTAGDARFAYPAALLAESGDAQALEQARAFFQTLAASDPQSPLAAAGLAAAGDATAADSSKLPPIASLIEGIDVKSLEDAGVAPLLAKRARDTAGPDPSAKKRKRSGKPRLPKDYDPAKKPDPERWLPKRDRSTYKPKRKDKKKMTQGGGADNTTESVLSTQPAASVKTSTAKTNKKKKKGKK